MNKSTLLQINYHLLNDFLTWKHKIVGEKLENTKPNQETYLTRICFEQILLSSEGLPFILLIQPTIKCRNLTQFKL